MLMVIQDVSECITETKTVIGSLGQCFFLGKSFSQPNHYRIKWNFIFWNKKFNKIQKLINGNILLTMTVHYENKFYKFLHFFYILVNLNKVQINSISFFIFTFFSFSLFCVRIICFPLFYLHVNKQFCLK